MNDDNHEDVIETSQPLVEGLDFHFDGGLMVLTREFLLKRGFCCKNGCRHCPYGFAPEPSE